MSTNNTMIKVNGAWIKTPSSFSWGLQDVSASDAGRTQDALMHKNMVAQKRKVALTWAAPTPAEARAILTAFNSEYFNVTYYDPLDGDMVTRTFYAGDKSAPVKVWMANNKRYEQISFDIIER